MSADPNDNAVIPFMVWVKEHSGVSEATARRICVPGGSGPPLIQLSARRLGVRYGDHKSWKDRISREPIEYFKGTRASKGVYVVGFDDYVKIGYTGSSFSSRILALQTGAPHALTVYTLIRDATRKDERALHTRFARHRLDGEWFRKAGRLAAWIIEDLVKDADRAILDRLPTRQHSTYLDSHPRRMSARSKAKSAKKPAGSRPAPRRKVTV